MNEIIIKVLIKLFTLIEDRIPQNVCKVFCVATIVGVFFSALCVDGPYTGRAVFFCFVCLMLACFFGSMALMYEEVYED